MLWLLMLLLRSLLVREWPVLPRQAKQDGGDGDLGASCLSIGPRCGREYLVVFVYVGRYSLQPAF